MAKTTLIIPNEEQSRFYKLIFDGSSFSWAINTIESLIKDEKSYFPLMKSLREKFGYDNVEDIDHYHNNTYFDPSYKTTEKDSCDFLMIGVSSKNYRTSHF
jgi:hypothetical protein